MADETKEPTVAELLARLDRLEAANEDLKTQLAKKEDIVTPEELPKIPTEPVEHKGKKYMWRVAAFQLPGSTDKHLATDASTDDAIIGQILKIDGQQILREQL